ncbi:MAG: DUF4382 domain-containing protein [Armatimonadota bacterium]
MKRSKLCQFGLFVLLLLSLFGCGGAGGSLAGVFNLFITDDASATYQGVWVKLYKAELQGDGGKSVVLFDSPEGVTVNLRQLNDGASKFLLLAPGTVPDGTYNKVQFEVNKTVNLVAAGSGIASTAQFPAALDNPAGNSLLTANLSPSIVMPGANKVVIDFDLKHWDVVNGIITPVLKHHDGTGLEDGSRHERFEYHGTIGAIGGTAPALSFDFSLKSGGTIHVTTDETTDIVGQGDNAGLTAGRRAEILGIFDPITNSVKANIIHYISDHEASDLAKAAGKPSNINSEAGSFELAPKYTRGFAPKGDKVLITTDSNTVFKGKHGVVLSQADFFAALSAAGDHASIDLDGTYNDGSNTLAAKDIHIENDAEFADAKAYGLTSNPNLEGFTFDLAIAHSEGLSGASSSIKIQLTPDAEIKGPHGVVTTKEQFFSLLAEKARAVRIRGSFNSDTQTLLAGHIEYVVDQTVNITAKGSTSNPNNQTGEFDFLVTQASGIDLSHTTPIHLTVNANATFTGPNGEALNYDTFFNLLIAGSQKLNITGAVTLPGGAISITSITVQASDVIQPDARGATSTPNSEAGSFVLTLSEHHGFDPAEGPMNVLLAEGAVLKGPQGISINRGQLFSYLTEHSRTAKVKGTYSDGIFTATKVELIFNQ